MEKIKCFNCKKVIKVFPYELKRGKKYCSKRCFNKKRYTHRTIDNRGYVLIYAPYHPKAKGKGYVYEHRLIMEKHLNRFLNPIEHIHHLDGNRQNNVITNLLLTTNSEHKKIHKEVGKKTRFTTENRLTFWKNKKSNANLSK